MPYCTQDDIRANLKAVKIASNTAVTPDALTDMIDQEGAVIDSYISRRYALPITDTSALNFLKAICIDLVVFRVAKVLQIKDSTPLPNGSFIQDITSSSIYREAMRKLRDIGEGRSELPGITRIEKKLASSSANTRKEDFTFKYNEQQW